MTEETEIRIIDRKRIDAVLNGCKSLEPSFLNDNGWSKEGVQFGLNDLARKMDRVIKTYYPEIVRSDIIKFDIAGFGKKLENFMDAMEAKTHYNPLFGPTAIDIELHMHVDNRCRQAFKAKGGFWSPESLSLRRMVLKSMERNWREKTWAESLGPLISHEFTHVEQMLSFAPENRPARFSSPHIYRDDTVIDYEAYYCDQKEIEAFGSQFGRMMYDQGIKPDEVLQDGFLSSWIDQFWNAAQLKQYLVLRKSQAQEKFQQYIYDVLRYYQNDKISKAKCP